MLTPMPLAPFVFAPLALPPRMFPPFMAFMPMPVVIRERRRRGRHGKRASNQRQNQFTISHQRSFQAAFHQSPQLCR